MRGELIAVMAYDSLVRWFVSRLMVYRYSAYEFIDCDLTRKWCLRLIENSQELVNKTFIWDLPQRPYRFYEEDFIARVLAQGLTFVCVVATAPGNMPRRLLRLCTQSMVAELVPGAVHGRLYDYRTGEKSVLRIVLR